MSQYLSMLPSQQMRLEQRLTPQLIQSMEILQLPLLALEARIREELETNPVLEELEHAPQPDDASPKEDLAATAEAESFDRLDKMAQDLDLDPGDLAYGRSGGGDGERDAKMDAMANTASRGISIEEHLLQQWGLIEADSEIKAAGEAIIEWMDEDGYLRCDSDHRPSTENGDTPESARMIVRRTDAENRQLMNEIAASRNPPIRLDLLEKALKLVQTLEPAGVAARDLAECLLIQLSARDHVDPLVVELVGHHLTALAKNQFPQVAKATGRTIDQIKSALATIGKLNHHPGLLVQPGDVPRISPDIIVDYADEGDGYTVRLARGNSTRLRVSSKYREMLRDKSQDKQAREFIKKRVEAANALIDAIQYRRERLLGIAKLILERQREFFDFGPQFLNVLRMRDLADEFNCDPSTISRTVDGKYIQTPRGIFPLRMFFIGGTTDESGESVSWDSIKAKVKEIIDAEDKSRPLSDDEIVARLAEANVHIARRTVVKYRSLLNIPIARQRRQFA